MAITYSITITNASHVNRQFLLFQDLPTPSNLPRGDAFTCVYQRSGQIQGDGGASVMFETASEWFAIYGTEQGGGGGDGRVRIITIGSQPAPLGPNGSYQILTTSDGGSSPKWGNSNGKSTPVEGAFTIAADDSFTYPNRQKIYLGVGARNPANNAVVPVQTYQAKPNTTNLLSPRPKYYIAFGSHQPGTVVDPRELGNVLTVDFTGAGLTNVGFRLTDRNTYVPESDPEQGGVNWSYGPYRG